MSALGRAQINHLTFESRLCIVLANLAPVRSATRTESAGSDCVGRIGRPERPKSYSDRSSAGWLAGLRSGEAYQLVRTCARSSIKLLGRLHMDASLLGRSGSGAG